MARVAAERASLTVQTSQRSDFWARTLPLSVRTRVTTQPKLVPEPVRAASRTMSALVWVLTSLRHAPTTQPSVHLVELAIMSCMRTRGARK